MDGLYAHNQYEVGKRVCGGTSKADEAKSQAHPADGPALGIVGLQQIAYDTYFAVRVPLLRTAVSEPY